MGTQKNLCQDCKNPRADCICEDKCDFCGHKETDCRCGRDHDPYGNKIFDHKEWLRGEENARNMLDAYDLQGQFLKAIKED